MVNKKFRHFLNHFSLKSKLFISYGLLILFSLSSFGVFSYKNIYEYIISNTVKSYLGVLKQANENITFMASNYEKLIYAIYINQKFENVVEGEFYSNYDKYNAYTNFNGMISSMINTYNYIPGLKIFVSKKNISSQYIVSFTDIEDNNWLDFVLNKQYSGILWYPETLEYSSHSQKVLWVSKVYKKIYEDTTSAIIRLEIDPTRLFFTLEDLDIFGSGYVYLTNENGIILYGADREAIFSSYSYDVSINDESGYYKQNKDGEEYYFFYDKIPEYNWTLIGGIPANDIYKLTQKTAINISFIALSLIIIGFLLIYLIANHFTKRLSLLTREMVKVSRGTFEITVDESMYDEIGEMNKVFNLMIQKLKKSMNEIAYMKTKELELQLKMLQAQINPHFLYNTLSTINWMAANIGADDIVNTVSKLVTFYRIGLSKGKTFIPVKDEIRHVEAYIDILRIRTKDKISFFFDIEPSVLDLLVPKMILQPLVENAILHGIEAFRKEGKIIVRAQKEKNTVILSVEDNGIGMEEDTIKKILVGKAESSGYGLNNIVEKLKLISNSEDCINIKSDTGKGTIITVKIPVEFQSKEAKND